VSATASLYRLFADIYLFPEANRTRSFISGELQQNFINLASGAGFPFDHSNQLILDTTIEVFESEFIALHEVGMGGAPCALHSGHYMRDRSKTMEEVLRFYRFFDFKHESTTDHFPDHLSKELQFMAYLEDQYAAAELSGGDFLSPLLAQRDFITRNLNSWVGELAAFIESRSSISFNKETGHLLVEFVAYETQRLNQLADQSPEECRA
jgi:DMSO reductase family type II enzyme chaperone|tara:strand:+ start:299 stop:925 length:627 start_codon:yes stop_codon:yes gene_type:complete